MKVVLGVIVLNLHVSAIMLSVMANIILVRKISSLSRALEIERPLIILIKFKFSGQLRYIFICIEGSCHNNGEL